MPVQSIDSHAQQLINFPKSGRLSYVVTAEENEKWRRVTEKSLEEYLDHHDAGGYDELTKVIMRHFQDLVFKYMYLSSNGRKRILDVGCGVGRQVPLYASDVAQHFTYIGLDPIQMNLEREYHFLCAKVEDLPLLTFDVPFDLALFATSLDHVVDVDVALDAVKSSMSHGGYMLFWVGLHDSMFVAETTASQVFRKIFSSRTLLFRTMMALGWMVVGLPRLIMTCVKRERRMRKRIPLDSLHFHYFVEKDIVDLSAHGEIVEKIRVPGTNSLFVVVRIP